MGELSTLGYIILFTLIGSVFSLIGGVFLLLNEKKTLKYSHFLAAFAAGTLLGTVFFDLFPEAIEEAEHIAEEFGVETNIFLWALLGILGFFLLAKVFIDEFGKYTGGRFIPPLVGGVNAEAMSALIGLGFILMLPNLANALKAALKAPKLDLGPIIPPLAAGAAYPVNVARTVKDTYNKRNEYILGPEGKPMRRGFKAAIFGLNMYEKAPGSANPETNASGGTGGGGGGGNKP